MKTLRIACVSSEYTPNKVDQVLFKTFIHYYSPMKHDNALFYFMVAERILAIHDSRLLWRNETPTLNPLFIAADFTANGKPSSCHSTKSAWAKFYASRYCRNSSKFSRTAQKSNCQHAKPTTSNGGSRQCVGRGTQNSGFYAAVITTDDRRAIRASRH